jgi:hypothetical protein
MANIMTINELINSGKVVKVFGIDHSGSRVSEMKCRFGGNDGANYFFTIGSYPIYIEEQHKLSTTVRFCNKKFIYYKSLGVDWFKSATRTWFLDKQKAYEEAISRIRKKKRALDKIQMSLQIELSNFKNK